MKRKLLSMLLTFTMMLSLFVVPAYADAYEGIWNDDHTEYLYRYDGGEWLEGVIETVTDEEKPCLGKLYVAYNKDKTEQLATYLDKKAATVAHTPDKAKEITVKPATCEKDGTKVTVVYCKVCGEEISRSAEKKVPATGHVASDSDIKVITVEGSCTTQEEYDLVNYCINGCGTIVSTKHVVGDFVHVTETVRENEVIPASCDEAGSYDEVVKCKLCKEELSRRHVEVSKAHDWAAKVTKEATCGEDGEKLLTCKKCGATKTEVIKATGIHTPADEWEIVYDDTYYAPTCQAMGHCWRFRACKDCGQEISGTRQEYYIPMIDHVWDEGMVVIEAENCAERYMYYTCNVCGTTKYSYAEHKFAEPIRENEVAPTCTEPGTYDEVRYCEVCGFKEVVAEKKVDDEKPSLGGHKPGDVEYSNIVGGEYTHNSEDVCKKAGSHYEMVKCSVCGEVISSKSVLDSAVEHDWKEEVEGTKIEPTCVDEGSVYKECANCGAKKLFSIPATSKTGHGELKQETVKVIKAATCTEGGTKKVQDVCTVCGQKVGDPYDVPVPAGHDWKVNVVIKEATCEEDGEANVVCSRCGEQKNNYVIDKLGHDLETTLSVVWSKEEGKYNTGVKVLTTTCKRCDYVDKVLSDLEAENIKEEVTVKPTCLEEGKKVYTYTLKQADGTVFTSTNEETLEKIGHTAGDTVEEKRVEATCEENGSYEAVAYCSVCGKEIKGSRKTVTIPAAGHKAGDPVEENVVEPTILTEGSLETVQYCVVCGKEIKGSRQSITIPATGHKRGEMVKEYVIEPTCTTPGSYEIVYYCADDDCDPKVELSRSNPVIEGPLGHNYVWENVDIVKATCTEKGYRDWLLTCDRCGDVDVDDNNGEHYSYGPLGHDAFFTKFGVVVKEPTTTEPGEKCDVTYCGICFAEVFRGPVTEIPAIVIPDGAVLDDDGLVRIYKDNEVNADADGIYNAGELGFVYVVDGVQDKDEFSYVDFNGGKFLVANGTVATFVNGLAQDPENPDTWYYVANGMAQTQYTGLALYDGAWFYVKEGKLDTTYSGLVEYDGGRFLVGAGRIITEVTGLGQDPATGNWYYFANGQVQDYTGEVFYNGAAFSVKNGALVG